MCSAISCATSRACSFVGSTPVISTSTAIGAAVVLDVPVGVEEAVGLEAHDAAEHRRSRRACPRAAAAPLRPSCPRTAARRRRRRRSRRPAWSSSATTEVKSLPLATKSVLQLSSTIAATLPSTTTSTAPSVASRSCSLRGLAQALGAEDVERRAPRRRRTPPARSCSPSSRRRSPCAARRCPWPRTQPFVSLSWISVRPGSAAAGSARARGSAAAVGAGGGSAAALAAASLASRSRCGGGGGVTRLLLLGGLGRLLLGRERPRGRRRRLRLGALRRTGLRLLARPQPLTLDDGVGDDAAHQVGGADGVVVAGDHEVDDVGIAVGVDDRDHRDAERLASVTAMCSFLVSITNTASGSPLQRADAAQVALELGELALDLQAFLLDHLLGLARRDAAARARASSPRDRGRSGSW